MGFGYHLQFLKQVPWRFAGGLLALAAACRILDAPWLAYRPVWRFRLELAAESLIVVSAVYLAVMVYVCYVFAAAKRGRFGS